MKRDEKGDQRLVTISTKTRCKTSSVKAISCVWNGRKKKRFVQKIPTSKFLNWNLRKWPGWRRLVSSITYERYKLFNRSQEVGEALDAFHAALTARAAKSALDTLEDELVRDLFISKMRSPPLQDTFTFETLLPDGVLKRALKFEQNKRTTQAFQKLTLGTAKQYRNQIRK